MVAFAAVLEGLNDLFGSEDFTEDQKVSFLETLLRTLLADESLVQQARVNTPKQFTESPDFDDAVVGAVADNQGSHNKMADHFFTNAHGRTHLVNSIAKAFYEYATASQSASACRIRYPITCTHALGLVVAHPGDQSRCSRDAPSLSPSPYQSAGATPSGSAPSLAGADRLDKSALPSTGAPMRLPAALAATALVAVSLTASPADARIIDRGHFTNTFTDPPYDCDGLLMAQDSATVHITFRGNLRGSSPFPFYVENTRGTAVTTNLETGGTLTQKFTGTGHDHTIVDNGDGTMTITIYDSGQNRVYDQFGNMVFHDAGSFRFSFDINYQGTPGDPSDDTEVPDSFQIVREPTGRDDTSERSFCEDLLTYTTAP